MSKSKIVGLVFLAVGGCSSPDVAPMPPQRIPQPSVDSVSRDLFGGHVHCVLPKNVEAIGEGAQVRDSNGGLVDAFSAKTPDNSVTVDVSRSAALGPSEDWVVPSRSKPPSVIKFIKDAVPATGWISDDVTAISGRNYYVLEFVRPLDGKHQVLAVTQAGDHLVSVGVCYPRGAEDTWGPAATRILNSVAVTN
jgi:hypothetical protein